MQSSAEQGGKRTGWAIAVALVATVFFYIVYGLLFEFIVQAYASYDPSFATGVGALVLLVFGSHVLAFVSGATLAHRVFPQASATGLFCGLTTLLVFFAAMSVMREAVQADGSWIAAAVNVTVVAITIFALRLLLLRSI